MSASKDTKRGTWKVYIRYIDWMGNKQIKTKRGFQTKKEALAWERGFLQSQSKDMNMSFKAFAEIYMNDMKPRIRESTMENKRYIIDNKLIPYFGSRSLASIKASDADVRRLAEKSGEGGLTISELLENFIGDLVDGTYSNGSDERMYAEQWYQRCWFAMFSDDTFLKFLLLWGDLDAYIDLMDELESNKKEMAEMTADAEEYSSEERDELQEYINDLQKEKDYYWNKFLERKRQKESYVFEKEIENIMAWKSQLNTLLDTENL